MRFDNPIKNHKFKYFKDIAAFEDVKSEYRNDKKFKTDNLKKYFLKNDLKNLIKN